MSNLVFIGFDDHADAVAMREALLALQEESLISMDDVVVVKSDAAGQLHLHDTVNFAAIGAAAGAFWGLLIGSLLATPLIGLATGVAAGVVRGKLDQRIWNESFRQDLAEAMRPGMAGVFLLVRRSEPEKVLERLGAFAGKGRVLQTSLPPEKEAQLRAFIEGEQAPAPATQ
jgi:uncharacterized membrane protein